MKKYLAIASWIAAIGFATAGMIIPPQGEIDGSVLILIAQLFLISATFLGVDSYVNIIRQKVACRRS